MSDKRTMGCLPGKIDIRDFRVKRKVSMAVNYPEEFECNRMSMIKDQREVGSCVAHAAAEALEHFDGGETTLSTNFIYGIHRKLYGTKGPGMYLREACKIARNYGDPAYKYCPGNCEVDDVYDIANQAFYNKEAMEDAEKRKISSFAKVSKLDDIKYALMNYGPVLASIKWYDRNNVYDQGILKKSGVCDGRHAILIKGWNRNGWICQNSWGINWGINGYFILPVNYGIEEAYTLVPQGAEDSIKKPKDSELFDFICKIINGIINLFVSIFRR